MTDQHPITPPPPELVLQWNGQIPADTAHQISINWARDALHVLANELESQ
jgi:hypothetical protein